MCSGPFIRPHPLFWRFIFAVSVLYETFLIGLLFLNRDQARAAFGLLDPKLGVPLAERSYASDCALTWKNIEPAVFDRFFVSHFLGWFGKSLMLRDQVLCWIVSVTWEVIEILFTHHLPNFAGPSRFSIISFLFIFQLTHRPECNVDRVLVGSMDPRCSDHKRVGHLRRPQSVRLF